MNIAGNLGNLSSGITGPVVRDFTTNGTWSKPAGVTCIDIIAIGAGGGGGGGATVLISPRYQASGGAGGGGGGYSCLSYAGSGLNSSPYCVCLGVGGAGGAGASVNGTNGLPGCNGGNTNLYQSGGFPELTASGGGGGGGGCYCANTTSCIVVAGGAGGFGSTYLGNTGGRAVYKYQDIRTSDSACSGNGPRGAGSGAGYDLSGGLPGAGGSQCFQEGLRFGKGGDQIDGSSFLPGCVYGAGGGGGCAVVISGTVTKAFDGGAGANGMVRIIEYYS